MSTEVFDVQMPDGTIISGVPKGTKQSDVMARYSKMKGSEKPPAPSADEMNKRKAASTAAFEKARPGFEGFGLKTALDIPLDIGIGIEQASGLDPMHPIATAPKAGLGMLEGMGRILSGKGGLEAIGMLRSGAQAVKEGGQALRNRNIPEAMQASGRGYAAVAPLVAPFAEVPGEVTEQVRASDVPRKLLQRAEDIRSRQPVKLPGTGIGLKSSVVHRAAQEVAKRRPIARTYEAVGEKLAGKNRPPLTRSEIAADEAARIRQAQNLETDKTPAIPQEKLNIPYPKPPSFIDVPITDPASAMKSIEEKIGPSGRIAKKTSQVVNEKGQPTPFGRTLLQEVPELATAPKGPQADAALYSGYQRVLQRVNEAEDAIPEGTTVDNIPIVSGFEALKQEYIDRGLVKSADAIDKLSKQWVGLMDLPWGEFLSRKRAFFAEHNLSSSPMRRAYGVLMEASERAAPQLSEANQAYSTVRRALDNAQIDPNTGRRISQVGKASKTPVHQMQESRPLGKTEIKSEPVKNRAEALERLEQPERRKQNVPVKTERRQLPSITDPLARNHLLLDDEPEPEELPKLKLHKPDF